MRDIVVVHTRGAFTPRFGTLQRATSFATERLEAVASDTAFNGLGQTLVPIVHVLATICMTVSATMLFVPVLVLPIGPDPARSAFLWGGLSSLATCFVLWALTRRRRREFKIRDGVLLVVCSWTLIPLVGAVPLLAYFGEAISFTDAYFEMASALTTTGATVLSGLDSLPPSVNLWRHLMQWLGGMGIIVLAVAILPLLGVGGMQLFKAETPGPMKDTKLTPRVAQTAKALWLVYAAITLCCMVSLRLAGMSWFDALCHAFSAMALGGFSTHDASIGHFDSARIEMVLTAYQLIAALSFATHFLAWRSRNLRVYATDPEARWVWSVLAVSCLGTGAYLSLTGTYPDLVTALRHATFNVITIATDCGYATQDFAAWPVFVPMWMLFLSCVTCSSGSTGGGVKMIRTLVIGRQASIQVRQLLHPKAMLPLRIGARVMPDSLPAAVLGFTFLYFLVVVMLTFALLLSGLDFVSAFSAIIACINNMGPGLGVVGPDGNYAGLTALQSWICVVAMICGRLELFPVLTLFTVDFWRR